MRWMLKWAIKSLCSLLLCCLLLSMPLTAWASTAGLATEAEIRQSLQNSQRLSEIMAILRLNSDEAKQQLLKVTEELLQLKKELQELKQAHAQLTDSYNKMMSLSQKQDELLTKINSDFEKYSKETKSKIRSLEAQKTVLEVVAGLAVGALIWKYIK